MTDLLRAALHPSNQTNKDNIQRRKTGKDDDAQKHDRAKKRAVLHPNMD